MLGPSVLVPVPAAARALAEAWTERQRFQVLVSCLAAAQASSLAVVQAVRLAALQEPLPGSAVPMPVVTLEPQHCRAPLAPGWQ
jgi:hypothetical protein